MAKTKSTNDQKSVLSQVPIFTLFLPIGVLVMILVTMFLILKPQIESVMSAREELDDKKEQLISLTEKFDTLEAQSEEELKAYLTSVNRVLPEKKPVFKLVNALSGLNKSIPGVVASDYTINPGSLASASAENEEVPGELNTMDTELELSGSYDDLLEYLTKLQKMAPLIGVQEIILSGEIDPANQGTQTITVTLKLDVFYALSPQSIGRTSDPLPEYTGDLSNTQSELDNFETFQVTEFEFLEVDQQRENPFSY
jgi:hypothetical protein